MLDGGGLQRQGWHRAPTGIGSNPKSGVSAQRAGGLFGREDLPVWSGPLSDVCQLAFCPQRCRARAPATPCWGICTRNFCGGPIKASGEPDGRARGRRWRSRSGTGSYRILQRATARLRVRLTTGRSPATALECNRLRGRTSSRVIPLRVLRVPRVSVVSRSVSCSCAFTRTGIRRRRATYRSSLHPRSHRHG
jgi:hypothetical protein